MPESGDFGKAPRDQDRDRAGHPSSVRGRRKAGAVRLSGEAAALFQDAVSAARELRRKHRTFYDADLKTFRTTVRKAHGRVFRLRP
ncbi:MAG TPA: hypothetical protein VLH09_00865, partial [Bryobacteraceae bacterium]|nr:hypothetical protein [Bryobacteraceae bacterium]